MASVKVAVRVRPLNKREDALGSTMVVKVNGNVIHMVNSKSSDDVFTSRDNVKQFTFDHSYWSVDSSHENYASQDKIFHDLGIGVVESAFSGYNACIFAYGQTGSGKTHTMMGSESNPGLTPRICEGMFANMDKPDLTCRTEVSYLEIYNERVRDLLRDGMQATNLKVREHAKDGPYVQNLSRRVVTSYREIGEILRKGNINRTTASTGMNEHSSRSHAIFTIYFSQARISGDLPSEINSKIHLVDLAGSERADTAGTSGERLREGGSINKSLVILGNVISALAEMNDSLTSVTSSSSLLSTTSSSSSSSRRFIPYRNSVLTWLLKDSLGGNSRTIMVATISPADCCYAETLSTLRYAKRAKKIVNMPSVNEDGNVRLIRELRAENAKLKRMLADAMMQEGLTPPREVEETREKLNKNEEKMQELMEAWTDKWKEVINVLREHEMLALRKEGSGVLLDSGLPYLLCIDDSVLSTGMKLYHIKEGDTIVGRDNPIHKPDIALSGRFIENIHCIVRFENSNCFLIPGEDAMCCIDSIQVIEPTKLTQGSMIQLGRNHFFRFNNPAEAAKLREEMNEGYDRGNMSHIWKDIQRAWSTFSMTDSAIDSDVSIAKNDTRFKEWLDSGVQETKKISDNVILKDKDETEDNKCDFLADAQLKIKILNKEIENELKSVDKSESEEEPSKGIGEEYEILRMEKERQEEEWCELEKQKHHQHSLRLDDQILLNRRQEHMEKLREVEMKIWSGEIEEMRALMDEEVQQLCDAPLNCLARTHDDFSNSEESNFNSLRHAPLSCRGTSFDRCPLSKNLGTFECISLDGHQSRKDFPPVHSSTPLRSLASGGTFEDVLPLDIETFKLVSSIDERFDDLTSLMELPMDLAGESYSSSFSLSLEDETSMLSVGTYISNMYKMIKSIYFDEFSKSTRFLQHETKHLHFTQQINEKLLMITKFISRLEKLLPDGLKSNSFDGKIELLENLLNLYESISMMNHQQNNSMFFEAAQTLLKINQVASLARQLIDEEIGDEELKTLIQTEVCMRREMFLYGISENWDELIKWNNKKSRHNKESCSMTSLDLKQAVNNRKKLKATCEAMHLCGSLDDKLRTFSKNFVTQLMVPGIKGYFMPHCEDTRCLIQVFNSSDSSLVHQKTKEELKDEHSLDSSIILSFNEESANPDTIIARIEQSLRLLWCAFSFSLETDPSYSLVAIVGKYVYEDVIQSLCQHCLVPYFKALNLKNVPNLRQNKRYHIPESKSWKHFNDMLLKVHNLQAQIIQFGFITTLSSSSLHQLLPTIRGYVLRRHKQFNECLLKIGISTLGVSVNVSPDHPIGVHLGEDVLGGDESKDEGGDEDIKWSLERFIVESINSCGALKMPFCSVSLPCCDIVKLSYVLLHESQSCCVHVAHLLQPCFEDITQHFLNLITNHQLPKNPIFDALLHNSCLFMAQHLMIIERHFSHMLSSLPVEFMEEAFANEKHLRTIRDKLKNVAEKIFSDSVSRQKIIVKQLLPNSASFACAADDGGVELKENIKTILDNIQEISNNWNNILSSSLYFRSIGTLIDELIGFIIRSILSILEFSEEDCLVLREVIEDVMNTAPNFLITSLSSKVSNIQVIITENVSSWLGMTELHRLLNSSLADIRDRWASGLGPLSIHFTGDQVVSLVRAIFETTQNRETVIKEILSNPSVHK